jgi:hypothetical protein
MTAGGRARHIRGVPAQALHEPARVEPGATRRAVGFELGLGQGQRTSPAMAAGIETVSGRWMMWFG